MYLPPNNVTSIGDEVQLETTHQDMEMRLWERCPASPNIYICILFLRVVCYLVTHQSLCLLSRKPHNIIPFIFVCPCHTDVEFSVFEASRVRISFRNKNFQIMDVNLNKIFTAVNKIIINA
jgi:hypothetical protein